MTLMLETHPFGIFVPTKVKYLLLGSFTALKRDNDLKYDWFYGSSRNQFWPILEKVYDLKLENKQAKRNLFTKLQLALGDIIYQCERKKESSLDVHLTNCIYNKPAIKKVLQENKIQKVFFSSHFVETEFKKHFKEIIIEFPKTEYFTLPSPSPRYAAMKKEEKIKRYKSFLPELYN